jgi:8-hydroxy-5-deazaflavin:NADPH oxidoreductase
MIVTIIGAGMMGRGIGTRLIAGGTDVELIDKDDANAQMLAQELSGQGKASATVGDESRLGGEIIVLALPYGAAANVVAKYGEQLGGKIIVDISNPIDFSTMDSLLTPVESSAAEEVAKLVPPGTPVVKAFNTTFGQTLVDGQVAGQQLEVLIAGDDDAAKGKVAALVEAGGLQSIDVGPLRRARQLEHLGFLHISLQERLGSEFRSAVKFIW